MKETNHWMFLQLVGFHHIQEDNNENIIQVDPPMDCSCSAGNCSIYHQIYWMPSNDQLHPKPMWAPEGQITHSFLVSIEESNHGIFLQQLGLHHLSKGRNRNIIQVDPPMDCSLWRIYGRLNTVIWLCNGHSHWQSEISLIEPQGHKGSQHGIQHVNIHGKPKSVLGEVGLHCPWIAG